jgi:uncharacterized protein YhaN
VATAASAALERWQADWAAACADGWLGAEGTPAPDAVRAALDLLAELGPAQAAESDLADRIAKMERDRDGFAAELAAMAAALDLPKAPAFDLWHQLRTRVEAAARAAEARAGAERRLAQAQEVRARFATRAEALEARRAPICAHFGVETLREAAERLAALSRRRQLAQERDAAGRALAAALGCATPEAAEKALAGTESDALAAEEASAAAARASAEEALREAHAARAAARAALVAAGGDDAVARIEAERAVVLTELADGLRRHLRLRLGILAVEAGLTAWRERHRGAMLERAAAAFAAITRGAYAGLDTQPGRAEGREELIAIPAGGGAKQVASLSKGTRFQLYLALRVAGHAEYARHRSPMPFLADDIMETFDDARAEAAFAALAQMGRSGQVIYLTHHRHLCEIARAAVPGVRVQSLEG